MVALELGSPVASVADALTVSASDFFGERAVRAAFNGTE